MFWQEIQTLREGGIQPRKLHLLVCNVSRYKMIQMFLERYGWYHFRNYIERFVDLDIKTGFLMKRYKEVSDEWTPHYHADAMYVSTMHLFRSYQYASASNEYLWPSTLADMNRFVHKNFQPDFQKYVAAVYKDMFEKWNPLFNDEQRKIHMYNILEQGKRPAFLQWNNGTVPALALQMYQSGDFTMMPILADAMEDAGFQEPEMLNHCRSDCQHFRGCWVVDLLLGKK